jgi:hypothetical protein
MPMTFLLAANLLAALGLLIWAVVLRRRLQRLHETTAALAASVGAQPPDTPLDPGGRGGMCISIEILNMVELARKESWIAGAFGSLTPALLQRIVYARTLKIMQAQLEQFDVKAEVRLHGGA